MAKRGARRNPRQRQRPPPATDSSTEART